MLQDSSAAQSVLRESHVLFRSSALAALHVGWQTRPVIFAAPQMLREWQFKGRSLVRFTCAQHVVQWTTGILRDFWQFSTPQQNSVFEPAPRPAQLPLTQAVGRLEKHLLG